MTDPGIDKTRFRLLATGLAVAAISAVFIGMIWNFLMAIFLAAIFSAMSLPLYRKVLSAVGSRKGLAALITLLILFACVLVPAIALVYLAAVQAGELAADIAPLVKDVQAGSLTVDLPEWFPFRDKLQSAGPQLTSKISELIGELAGFVVSAASAFTKGTASFLLGLFIMVYAMVFFLQEDKFVLTRLMPFTGLSRTAQDRLIERILSISRATIKGTLIIGVVQGTLGGIGFAVVGIQGAAFWGAVMAIASVVPGIGPNLVLVPGVIYLLATGQYVAGAGLGVWAAVVVSTIDNVMRPSLVGRDTQMPDLLILVSTFGGLSMFGAVGLIVGPVIAGLFIAIWQIAWEMVGGDEQDAIPGEKDGR